MVHKPFNERFRSDLLQCNCWPVFLFACCEEVMSLRLPDPSTVIDVFEGSHFSLADRKSVV